MCAQNSSFPKAHCFLPPHSITCFPRAPKATAARTQNPAGSRQTCFLAGCDSLYPGGRWVCKTVLKLRTCFPRGLSTITPAPTRPIMAHVPPALRSGATQRDPLRQAWHSAPAAGLQVRGVPCVCVQACVSEPVLRLRRSPAHLPWACTRGACTFHPESEPPPRLGAEKAPLVSPAPAADPPLDSGLEGVQASPVPTLTGPSWVLSPALDPLGNQGQKPSPTGPVTGEKPVSLQVQDLRPTWTWGQKQVVQNLRLSRGSDTGKRGPTASLLGQNQSSTTFLRREFGRVTETSEPQFSHL